MAVSGYQNTPLLVTPTICITSTKNYIRNHKTTVVTRVEWFFLTPRDYSRIYFNQISLRNSNFECKITTKAPVLNFFFRLSRVSSQYCPGGIL